jgi:2-polyprenyl-3-methyl-5-hydroxy-6-metoxy-1,4-benzoquinol methylase
MTVSAEVYCPVCNHADVVEKYADQLMGQPPTVDYSFNPKTRLTMRIVECLDCEHQFVPSVAPLGDLYESNMDQVYLDSLTQRRKSAEVWLATVRRYCLPISGKPSLIDIGCATGVFLDSASTAFDVEGVELSHWAASIAAKRHQVHRQPLSSLGLTRKFEVATLWGVIEHFDNPRQELAAIGDVLTSNGLIFIYTGDRSALIPKLLGKRWWWYQGMHIQYFTKHSLARLLRETGFTVIGSERLPIYFSLSSLGQSINRYRLAAPLAKLLMRLPLERFVIRLRISGEMLVVAKRG